MKRQAGFSGFEAIILLIGIVGVIGWIWNIVKIAGSDNVETPLRD